MRLRPITTLLLASLVGGGCGDPDGVVELAWVFVDRDGDPIYPGGVFSLADERDSCDLSATLVDQSVSYDLRVELEICDPECPAGCSSDECMVVPRRSFACNSARGNEPAVPAADHAYRFTVRAVVDAPALGIECRDEDTRCLAVPSPRERVVEAGLVTDLQVYQIAVDVDRDEDEPLDLEQCGCA